MANTDRLAEVAALLAERDETFRPFEQAQLILEGSEEPLWAVSQIAELLGYGDGENIIKAVNKAKVSAGNAGISLKENFFDGTMFDQAGEIFVTKYAALLIIMNADVRKPAVGIAQSFFALQVDKQRLEDEKRIKTRLDVVTENSKLNGVAKTVGVQDFQKFNGVGVSALYGGKTVAAIQHGKGLKKSQHYLDYAGSEELAANLFRITQTAAALRRQTKSSETVACHTHREVGKNVRRVIIQSGNTPPENLPAATSKVDSLATQVKKNLKSD